MDSSEWRCFSCTTSLKNNPLDKREIQRRLQYIYNRIPPVDCQHCQACCRVIFWFQPEEIMIREYLQQHGREYITWTEDEFRQHDMKCPYLENNRCSIYPVRPVICRLQGTIPELPCKHNKSTLLSPEEVAVIKKEMDTLVQETNGIGRYFGTRKISNK